MSLTKLRPTNVSTESLSFRQYKHSVVNSGNNSERAGESDHDRLDLPAWNYSPSQPLDSKSHNTQRPEVRNHDINSFRVICHIFSWSIQRR